MPKKKTPKNAFYFFMRDFKEQQEALGTTFRGGMKEVAILAGPAWKEISPEERMYYENMAAQEKMKEKGNLENKFTTTGISYAQLQREEEERRSVEMRMLMEIEGTVQGLSRSTTLKTHVFYFIHFNYYCRIEDGSYLVCEVAVAQFNLKEGVKDVYHTIIRHDKIPTGYSFEAKQTSEDSHQIPMPQDLTEGEPYHGNLFCYIKSFLEQNKLSNGQLPPLYTIDNHVDIAQCALTVLAEFHYPQDPDIFRVYPLSKLFYHLRNAAAPTGYDGFPAETLAERELDKDQYNFAPGIACSLHEKNDTCVYCSKSIVQRWAYLICDHCCKDLGIPMLRGKHIPINAALNVDNVLPLGSGDDDFLPVTRRNPRGGGAPRGGNGRGGAGRGGNGNGGRWPSPPRAPEKVPVVTPISVVDHSKLGPPEETAHHINLNAAAGGIGVLPSAPSSGGGLGAGSAGAMGAWGSGGKGLTWDKRPATVGMGAGRGVLTTSSSANVSSGRGALVDGGSGAIPKARVGVKGWINGGTAEEVSPPTTLRRPNNLPPSIANVLNFTKEEFPDLGGSNHVRTPAAVAGRGRGNTRLLLDDSGAVPGGLNEDQLERSFGQVAIGRGNLGRPGSRLAANFQGLRLN